MFFLAPTKGHYFSLNTHIVCQLEIRSMRWDKVAEMNYGTAFSVTVAGANFLTRFLLLLLNDTSFLRQSMY